MNNDTTLVLKAIKEIRDLLVPLMIQNGTASWISSWAAGKNAGGSYISLFADRAKFRMVTIYQEQWDKLPPEIVVEATERLKTVKPSKAGITEKDDAEDRGRLVPCNVMLVTRFKYPGSDEWNFGSVVHVIKNSANGSNGPNGSNGSNGSHGKIESADATDTKPQAEPTPNTEQEKPAASSGGSSVTPDEALMTVPPKFTGLNHAIDWSVEVGAYPDAETARAIYDALVEEGGAWAVQKQRPSLWIEHIRKLLKQAQ